MIFDFRTLSIKDYPLIEIWAGYENEESFFEFRIEVGFYKLYINPITIRWLKEG